MRLPLGISFLFLAVPALFAGTVQAEKTDLAGSADHALVGRYEGSVVTFYETKAYEELKRQILPSFHTASAFPVVLGTPRRPF